LPLLSKVNNEHADLQSHPAVYAGLILVAIQLDSDNGLPSLLEFMAKTYSPPLGYRLQNLGPAQREPWLATGI